MAKTDWQSAEVRTGALHLPEPPRRASFGSPFRYARAGARLHREGCGRGAIPMRWRRRCANCSWLPAAARWVCSPRCARCAPSKSRIAAPLAEAGLALYAQHVDRLDTGALVDLFRAEENACLLGTDALRDGVDVPGRSLRLVVFDKVPWPKPTILHKARRARFGKSYDDLLTRLRLKQAFGRLIRGRARQGLFRDPGIGDASRLLTAFPEAAPSSAAAWPKRSGKSATFLA